MELEKINCKLSFPQTSTSFSHTDCLWSVCNIRQPLPAHIKLMYLMQNLSSFSTFTTHHHVQGKQNISVTWHARHTRNMYEILMWIIKNITARGGHVKNKKADRKVSRLIFLFRIRSHYRPYNFFCFKVASFTLNAFFTEFYKRFKHVK